MAHHSRKSEENLIVTHSFPSTTLSKLLFASVMHLILSMLKKEIFSNLSLLSQSLDDVIKDLMASVHRELAEKQSLVFSMTFLPTKLELSTASADSTFIFEFSSPDARSNFEQAFEEAKKKLGNHVISKPASHYFPKAQNQTNYIPYNKFH